MLRRREIKIDMLETREKMRGAEDNQIRFIFERNIIEAIEASFEQPKVPPNFQIKFFKIFGGFPLPSS